MTRSPGDYGHLDDHNKWDQFIDDVRAGIIAPGITGPPGPTGPQGPTGADSTVPGPAGPAGPTGPRGLTGSDGPPGPQGPAGPAGANGATGPQGPAGAQGIQGPKGDKGDAGTSLVLKGSVATVGDLPAGATLGDAYVVTATGHVHIWNGSAWDDAGPIQGPKGDTGATGPQGVAGPTGPQGPQGDPAAIPARLGAIGPGPADVDAIRDNGWYLVGSGATVGKPTEGSGFYTLHVQAYNANEVVQVATDIIAPFYRYQRVRDQNGTWSPWVRLNEQGPTGPQGVAGPTGPTGPAGADGAAGAQGPTGPTGPQGPAGTPAPAGSMHFRGDYMPNAYVAGDTVRWQGDLWVATTDVAAGGSAPASPDWERAVDVPAAVDAYTKTESDGRFAPLAHTHSIGNVTGLQTALDAKADASALTSGLATKWTLWSGTQAQYDALPTKDPNTLYAVTG